MKDQRAMSNPRTMENTADDHPPYHAEAATAGKKKMNGNPVGPTADVSAIRPSHPARTVPEAKVKRSSVDLSDGWTLGRKAAKVFSVESRGLPATYTPTP